MPEESPVIPPIRAVPMTLFPTSDSLQSVVDLGESKLPISNKNDLFTLLMNYHNTLLALIKRENNAR